jgi:hypothetical protein
VGGWPRSEWSSLAQSHFGDYRQTISKGRSGPAGDPSRPNGGKGGPSAAVGCSPQRVVFWDPVITRDCEVVQMPLQHPFDPAAAFRDGVVHCPAELCLDGQQPGSHTSIVLRPMTTQPRLRYRVRNVREVVEILSRISDRRGRFSDMARSLLASLRALLPAGSGIDFAWPLGTRRVCWSRMTYREHRG